MDEIFNLDHITNINFDNTSVEDINFDEYNQSILKGYDKNKYKFINIKAIINFKPINILFYKNSKTWTTIENKIFKKNDIWLYDIQVKLLKDIANNKIIKIIPEHDIFDDEFINYDIQLYNHKEWNSAITIQRAWRLCRYCNKYEICKKYEDFFLKNIVLDNNSFIKDCNILLEQGNTVFLDCDNLLVDFNNNLNSENITSE
tara:strand:- start:60 stop:665 length:606 start_codon:yes stop_codon:yes gene_type:complete